MKKWYRLLYLSNVLLSIASFILMKIIIITTLSEIGNTFIYIVLFLSMIAGIICTFKNDKYDRLDLFIPGLFIFLVVLIVAMGFAYNIVVLIPYLHFNYFLNFLIVPSFVVNMYSVFLYYSHKEKKKIKKSN